MVSSFRQLGAQTAHYLYTVNISRMKNEPRYEKNQQNEYAPSEDSDQPGHPPGLISVFTVRMKKPWGLSYPLSAQRRLWSDWADAQADLSLCWWHTHFVGFVMSRLKCKKSGQLGISLNWQCNYIKFKLKIANDCLHQMRKLYFAFASFKKCFLPRVCIWTLKQGLFYCLFYSPSRLFHSFWAKSMVRWEETGDLEKNHLTACKQNLACLTRDLSWARTHSGEWFRAHIHIHTGLQWQ